MLAKYLLEFLAPFKLSVVLTGSECFETDSIYSCGGALPLDLSIPFPDVNILLGSYIRNSSAGSVMIGSENMISIMDSLYELIRPRLFSVLF
jgi:hypothetical protein